MGKYSPAETNMIMCPTRGMKCKPSDCLSCGWESVESKQELTKLQHEWKSKQKEIS